MRKVLRLSASTRIGKKPNRIRRSTICIGLIRTAAHFMKMKVAAPDQTQGSECKTGGLVHFLHLQSVDDLDQGFPLLDDVGREF